MHAKDDSEASVGSCALATKAGACLSPQGEFAQEPEWISECSEQETQRVLAAYLTRAVQYQKAAVFKNETGAKMKTLNVLKLCSVR